MSYVQVYIPGESTVTNAYQWEIEITRTFQDKLNEILHGFEFIWAYINDMLIIKKMIGPITWKM